MDIKVAVPQGHKYIRAGNLSSADPVLPHDMIIYPVSGGPDSLEWTCNALSGENSRRQKKKNRG